jgi:hypothetical protein
MKNAIASEPPFDLDERFLTRVPFGPHEGRLLCDETDAELAEWGMCQAATPKIRWLSIVLGAERYAYSFHTEGDELPADD